MQSHHARIVVVICLILLPRLITVPRTHAHQSGCHTWHSCPSDSGSYVCGDRGYCAQCPDNLYCTGGFPTEDCVSTHTTGSGATLLKLCVSEQGTLRQVESPQGFQHLQEEGYAVCSGTPAQTHGFETGLLGAGFGAPTLVQPNGPHTFPLTVLRDTTDGMFRVQHAFAWDTAKKDLTITMTLTNLTAAAVANVALTRYFDGNLDHTSTGPAEATDDVYEALADSVRGQDTGSVSGGHGLLLTALTFGTLHTTQVEAAAAWAREACTAGVSQRGPTAAGDFVGRVTYHLGTIAAGKSKTVKVVYRRF